MLVACHGAVKSSSSYSSSLGTMRTPLHLPETSLVACGVCHKATSNPQKTNTNFGKHNPARRVHTPCAGENGCLATLHVSRLCVTAALFGLRSADATPAWYVVCRTTIDLRQATHQKMRWRQLQSRLNNHMITVQQIVHKALHTALRH